MLIRSQDKVKIADTKTTSLIIRRDKNGLYNVLGLKDGVRFVMGTYEKEKTALDVLDMIWDLILFEEDSFEMPKDL